MKKLSIREVEELTNSIHEECAPENLPFPEEKDKWQQITIDDILKTEEKPIFSDDLWEEVQDMYEERAIINK